MRSTIFAASVAAALSMAVAPASATRSTTQLGIDALTFSPDGTTLAVGGADGAVRFWDLRTGKQTRSPLAGGGGGTGTLAFTPDGRTLVGRIGAGVSAWNVATAAQVGPTFGNGATALSPDGRTIAVAGRDAGDGVTLWNWSTHTRRGRSFAGGTARWYAVAFSPDGRTLASAGGGGVRLWSVRTHQRVAAIDVGKDASAVAFSSDGRTLAFIDDDGAKLWNIQTHEYAFRLLGARPKGGRPEDATSVVFSPDGRIVVTVGFEHTRFWNARTGAQILPALGRAASGGFPEFAFSPDGRTFATGEAKGQSPSGRRRRIGPRSRRSSRIRRDSPTSHSVATG